MLRRRLDRAIASGAPIGGSPTLRVRATQLQSPVTRRAIAAVLVQILDSAAERRSDPASRVDFAHEAVLDAEDGILALIELLRSAAPMSPRAVALAGLLAGAPDSPIVRERGTQTIRSVLAEVDRAR
jgi:hypothetical protein